LIDPLEVLILIAAADTAPAPDKLAAPCLTLNPSPTIEAEPDTDEPLEKMPLPTARTVAMPLIEPEPNLTLTPSPETVPSPVIDALETKVTCEPEEEVAVLFTDALEFLTRM
jgi:hypothetical protein